MLFSVISRAGEVSFVDARRVVPVHVFTPALAAPTVLTLRRVGLVSAALVGLVDAAFALGGVG